MFIEVTECLFTEDGNSICGKSMLINVEHIVRLESVNEDESTPQDDMCVKIIMSDGKEIISYDATFSGIVSELTGRISPTNQTNI